MEDKEPSKEVRNESQSDDIKQDAADATEGKHTAHGKHHAIHHQEETLFTKHVITLVVAAILLIGFNQFQLASVSALAERGTGANRMMYGGGDLGELSLDGISSTPQAIAAVFPVAEMTSPDAAMKVMFPTGTPEYGEALGVSFDEPVDSLAKLANMFRSLKAEVQKSNPEAFRRYVNLASNPYGVSCEYCCGVGPAGADKNGESKCGCQHNPALLSVTLYLTAYTDYSDAEVLREVMRWKTLFFPKNMIELGAKLGGGDTSVLKDLPGMVGGC
ncbi:TPA: hypothetical protein HA361_01390 [Candidatus Woesearchaeota archaeon]|nr:hypothetical protein [Candidatus Woesearchaeota archaeon]HII68425.1 hypothetical protein [Candidatus Woesearchaeota archaeon]